MSQHDTLTQALREAVISLETISRIAGKSVYSKGDVRSYATSRAALARAALSATQPAQAAQCDAAHIFTDAQIEEAAHHSWANDAGDFAAGARWAEKQLASTQAAQGAGEVVSWKDHVEQRIREWRCSTTNDDGDRVALEDFMSPHHVDDLIDYVCSAYTTPPQQPAPGVPDDVLSILRAIHRRPSDAGIWLDDITRILRNHTPPAQAAQQGEKA